MSADEFNGIEEFAEVISVPKTEKVDIIEPEDSAIFDEFMKDEVEDVIKPEDSAIFDEFMADDEVKEEVKVKKIRKVKKAIKVNKVSMVGTKLGRKKSTEDELAKKKILNWANLEEFPDSEDLFKGKSEYDYMKIKDIGIFNSKPTNGILESLYKELAVKNTINIVSNVDINQVLDVGYDIISSDRMWSAIEVADLQDGSNEYECWSGINRLLFLAFIYGADLEVPVSIQKCTTAEARNATIYANKNRKVRLNEKTELEALKATSGINPTKSDRDELYKMARNKVGANKYAVLTIVETETDGMKLDFPVSKNSSRAGGKLITTQGLTGYIGSSIKWKKKMGRIEYDSLIKESVSYLNYIVNAISKKTGFVASKHLAVKPLISIGAILLKLKNMNSGSKDYVNIISDFLINTNNISNMRSKEITEELEACISN